MEHREFFNQFEQETRRLRLNPYRLGGLAASGTHWEQPLLSRMRALEPGAAWKDVFPDLETPTESDPHLAELIASFDADPDADWDQQDGEVFVTEFHRVVLTHLGDSANIDQALRALRSLPDNVGWDAFQQALRAASS